MNADLDTKLAAIRAAPQSPEIGGTLAEARSICERQRGHFAQKQLTVACTVGGPTVFVAVLNDDARVTRVDLYIEGGDFADARMQAQKRFGPPDGEELTPEGFRAFIYNGGALVIAMYARGVRVSSLEANK